MRSNMKTLLLAVVGFLIWSGCKSSTAPNLPYGIISDTSEFGFTQATVTVLHANPPFTATLVLGDIDTVYVAAGDYKLLVQAPPLCAGCGPYVDSTYFTLHVPGGKTEL